MENSLQIFINEKYGEIRFIELNGKPYAVASDIAKALGYKNTSDAIAKHCKGVVKRDIPTNGGIQDMNIIPQSDIIRLAVKCPLQGADEFESWIFDEVIPKVLNTGKFDSVEEQLKKLTDTKERELSLGLYSMQQALKANPNDYTLSLICNNKAIELKQYLQEKQLAEQQALLTKQGQLLDAQNKKIDNLFVVGDRVQFVNEIKVVARATNKPIDIIYNLTYEQLKLLYGIDLEARSRNKKADIQHNRVQAGKKPYSEYTLNDKASKIVIIEDMGIWNEISKSLGAVKNSLLP